MSFSQTRSMGSHSRAGKVLLWLHQSRKVTLIASSTHFLFAKKKKFNNKKKWFFFSKYEMVSYPKKSNWNLKGTRILYFFLYDLWQLWLCAFQLKSVCIFLIIFFLADLKTLHDLWQIWNSIEYDCYFI